MEKIVSQLDDSGYFIAAIVPDESPLEPGVFLIPGGAVDVAPPEQRDGVRFRLGADLEWIEEQDHRASNLYQTSSGVRYLIGQAVQQGIYDGAGPLPSWLTLLPKPGPFYVWHSGEWELDESALAEGAKADERAWRDVQISRVVWIRERHRDELDAGLDTSLTREQFGELLTYIQALRDLPSHVGFPASSARPVPPSWLELQF